MNEYVLSEYTSERMTKQRSNFSISFSKYLMF